MQESEAKRTRQMTGLAILAAIGGAVGLLPGTWLVGGSFGSGGWVLLVGLVVLLVSLGELACAYSAWTQAPWALKPGPRAAGFAVAIALTLLGVAIALTMPVRTTFVPADSPITEAR